MTTWALQGFCPTCDRAVTFECSRAEETTPAGHRILNALCITCPEGHQFEGGVAEQILHGTHPAETS